MTSPSERQDAAEQALTALPRFSRLLFWRALFYPSNLSVDPTSPATTSRTTPLLTTIPLNALREVSPPPLDLPATQSGRTPRSYCLSARSDCSSIASKPSSRLVALGRPPESSAPSILFKEADSPPRAPQPRRGFPHPAPFPRDIPPGQHRENSPQAVDPSRGFHLSRAERDMLPPTQFCPPDPRDRNQGRLFF